MRIRGAKTEMSELGLDTEGMVESTAKLRSEIMALTGVDIMDGANQFKSTYKIMDELAAKWQDLTDIQQATVTELIAGKRQGNIVSSLMANFDTARDALETSMNSAGSAMKEHEKWQQSLEARILSLKSSWQALSQSFLSSDFLKSTLNGVINLVDGITKLIDTFGTFPTLMGTVAAGFSIFKNGGLFKTFNSDLDAFTSKIGIANKSFAELGKSFKSGGFKGVWDALKTPLSDIDLAAINKYNELIDAGIDGHTAYNQSMQHVKSTMGEVSSATQDLIKASDGHRVAIGKQASATLKSKVAMIGAKAAAIAFNTALTMGISLLIDFAISGIMKVINAKKDLAEEVENITSKFKEQHEELQRIKGDYDTSNESSMISRYERLSKGVGEFGENISLTADEYSEYQGIVNKIADQFPSLINGYDSQGNALLSCKDNVEALTQAYEDMISAQNRAILNNAGKIGEDFANKVEDNNSTGTWGTNLSEDVVDRMERDLNRVLNGESLGTGYGSSNGISHGKAIEKALENAGLANFDKSSWDYWFNYDQVIIDAFENAAKTNPKRVKAIIDEFRSGLEADVAEMKNIAQATLSEAFDISDSEFYDMSDTMQGVVKNIVNGFDYEFYKQYKDNPLGVQTYINDMLEQFKSFSDTEGVALDAAFNLKTQFNSGDISYGEYVDGLKKAGETIDGLEGLDEEVKTDIKLSLGLNEKGLVDEYDALVKKLSDSKNYDFKISETEAQDFLSGLSSEELPIAIDVITKLQNNGVEETVDEIKNAIETEIAKRGLSLDLTIEKAKLNFEALSTALSESVSGSGLSEESILAVEGMFKGLKGYDPSKLFERTANGIHLNSTELRKLNDESKKTNVAKVNKQMNSLGDIYNQTREELYQLTYGTKEYNDKLSDLNYIEQQIKDLEKLAAGYDGVASAYQEWQMVESAGSQRSMYEGILEGFEVVEDEISRGWIDDGTREFLELLYGEKTTITKIVDGEKVSKEIDIATASASDLKKAYEELDETIKHTAEGGHKGYSISDFFTVDDDGNSTSQGVYNFLDAIGHMEEEVFGGKDVIKRDDINGDGKKEIIGFDFQMVGGDKVIAEALGISEELVQIMKRASADAGFVVTLDGSFEQLDILREKAQKASEVLNKALKNKGQEDKVFSYNFNSTDEKDITNQLEKANKALNTFKKSGKIDLSIEGASEALTVTSTLQSMLDNLQRPTYMQIEVSQVEKKLQEPLRNLQELRTLTETEHQFKISGTDTSKLEESKQEIYTYFEGLDTDVKVKLGLIDDNGNPLTGKALQDKLNTGDITIQATIDIQTKMDEKLGILVDRQLKEAGLITEDEYQKRLKIYLQGDVDNTDAKEDVENATEEVVGDEKTKKDIEIIAETYGIENVENLINALKDKDLNDKTVRAIAEVMGQTDLDALERALNTLDASDRVTLEVIAQAIGEGDVNKLQGAIDRLSPNTVQAIAEALGFKDVESLKESVRTMHPNTVKAIAQALGFKDVESLKRAIRTMKGNTVDAKVNTDGQSAKIDALQGEIDGMKGKTVDIFINTWRRVYETVASGGKKKAAQRTGADPGGSDVNGTANVNGTTGRAFIRGDWRTKRSENALVGELGREIVVTPENRWYTVGDSGAEFARIPKNSIVFNHRQTEELLKNGKVTSNGGRAKALVNGTAYLNGSAHYGYGEWIAPEVKSFKVNYDYSSNDSDSDSKKHQEIFDWVEVAIERIEREIDNLDRTANSTYKSWSERNKALNDQITMVGKEISLQKQAIKAYEKVLSEISLPQQYIEAIKNGSIDIDNITDETLADKISDYQKWFGKILDCQDAIDELIEKEHELSTQKFDNIVTKYEGILDDIEHQKNLIEEYMAQYEGSVLSDYVAHDAKSYQQIANYYQQLVRQEQLSIVELEKEKAELIAELNRLVADGLPKDSEKYNELKSQINDVELQIAQANTAIIEGANNIAQSYKDAFDDVAQNFENMLSIIEHKKNMIEEGIAQSEAQGHLISKEYYNALASNERENIAKLQSEKAALLSQLETAMAQGGIEKGSNAW